MARGRGGVRLRKPKKAEDGTQGALDDIFNAPANSGGSHDFGPAEMSEKQSTMKEEPVKEAAKDSDDDDDDDDIPLPKQRRGRSSADSGINSKQEGIKTMPLLLLMLMVGTSVLPAVIYMGDYVSSYLSKNHVLGQMGYRLGIGNVPRRRVVSFYEKHAPEKLDDVPGILSKHYGDYPKLIKKLERKYQDYGYFVGWEQDEAPLKMFQETTAELYETWLSKVWNPYAPDVLKQGARNARYNLTYLSKQARKIWKKHLWPHLEPILGVPDGAEKQKRKDAAEARKRREAAAAASGKKTTRRRNTEYRDEEEH